jgi:N-acetylglutamate synthase
MRRAVPAAVAGWADARGAPRPYLQVEQSNDVARRPYDAAGYAELTTYHCRFGALRRR